MAKKTSEDSSSAKVSLSEALSELNDTLNEQDKKAKKSAEEHLEKARKFQEEFRGCLYSIIRPAMMESGKKFALIGIAREATKEDEQRFGMPLNQLTADHVSYCFQIRNTRYSFVVSISGNINSQKVFVGVYASNEKPIIKEYNLQSITAQLIEGEIANKVIELTKKLKK